MRANRFEWDSIRQGAATPESEFLRLAASIAFQVKTAASMCIRNGDDKHIREEMQSLIRRVVRQLAKVLSNPNRDSMTAANMLMSPLAHIKSLKHEEDECKAAMKECQTVVRRTWRRMRTLQKTNEIALQQEDLLRHSLAYDEQLIKKTNALWNEAAETAMNHKKVQLPKEFKSSKLRKVPYVTFAAMGLAALTAGVAIKHISHRNGNRNETCDDFRNMRESVSKKHNAIEVEMEMTPISSTMTQRRSKKT
uniref:Uncharacterized protein n=1 Tax=viral metagenome TaxID=1070528 RepID=A0A6C0C087_9ZZZZ